jgi:hypothetical protein
MALNNSLNMPVTAGVIKADGSAFSSQALANGELIIGNGATPVATTLTAGTGISIVNGAGTITISQSGAEADAWTEVTGTSQAMSENEGYTANNAALVSLSLPATSAVGDWVEVNGRGAGGWSIIQGAGQQIFFGNVASTAGATGSLDSTLQYDCVKLRALANDGSAWVVVSSVGNLNAV